MIIKFKYYKIKLFILIITLAFSSCIKSLDAPSREVAGEEDYWQSMSETKAGLLGIYSLMRSAMFTANGHWVYGDIREGDFAIYNRADLRAVKEGKLNASFPAIKELSNWQKFYAVVNAASVFIEKAPKVLEYDKRYTTTNLELDIAQARALRAFAYFYMARIWGDVPLVTKSFDNGSFPEHSKSKQLDVLDYAERELLACIETLPYMYGTDENQYYNDSKWEWAKVLFTKVSGYAILSHIAALQGRYDKVDAYTQFVIDHYWESNVKKMSQIAANTYGVEGLTGFFGIFSNGYAHGHMLSFRASYWTGEATNSGHLEQLTLAQPLVNKEYPDIYVERDTITRLFNDPDDRRFGLDTVNGLYRENYFINFQNDIPIFKKVYIIRDGTNNGNYAIFGSNLVFTRYEEILLLRAEALAVLNNDIGARELLNEMRLMRGLDRLTVLFTKPILEEVFEERRRELMGEGWRFYDLIRYHRIRKMDPKFNDLIDKGGIFWPISSEILSRNKQLEQNSYWK